MALSLDKISKEAPSLLNLAKIAVATIDKSSLNGQTAKVAVMLDYSGSMSRQYSSGAMQRITEKVLTLGTQFDDDGAIDFFVFDSHAAHLGEIGINDFTGSVARLTKNRSMGSTNYAEAFTKVRDHFGFGIKKSFFGRKKTSDQPVYVLFLTDGDPDDQGKAEQALRDASKFPIFWKFISIGTRSKRASLQTLDDLPGRFVDNANYKNVSDVDAVSDADLFGDMLEEFPEWLAEVRAKGLIK